MKPFIRKLLVAALLLNAFTAAALADALDNWTPCLVSTNPIGFQGFILTGAAYGNGRYVAVGQYVQDDYGVVEISDDGTNWTIPNINYYSKNMISNVVWDLYDVTFANGTFVAVGWDGYAGGNLYSSIDGISWNPHLSQITDVYDVTYGGGLFVAVGDGFAPDGTFTVMTNKNIFTTPDGVNWTARSDGSPVNNVDSLSDVAYGHNKYVAIGASYPTVGNYYFHTSSTGTAWTRTTSSYPLAGSISFCNGFFIAPSGPGTNLLSTDGSTWFAVTNNTASTFGRVIYNNGLYLATGGNSLFSSTDATNWVKRGLQVPSTNILSRAFYGNGHLFVVGYVNGYKNASLFNLPTIYMSDPLAGLGISSGFPPKLQLCGVQNWPYHIQSSSDMNPTNWQNLAAMTLTNSPCTWTDTTATATARFYRLTTP